MSADGSEREWLDGTRFVITGALGAMGAAMVTRLADAGAEVYALDVAPISDPQWSRLQRQEGPGTVIPHPLDVRNAEEWDEFAGQFEAASLDGLVNFAGVTLRSTLSETSSADWERVIGINLTGSFLAIRALAPYFADGSSIVNISSSAGLTGYFGAAYSASKWGLRGLARSAAMEFGSRGIRVNSVCPGIVDSPMTRSSNSAYDSQQAAVFYEECVSEALNGRGASLDEIADAVEFLLSPRASYINASDLQIDGGMVNSAPYARVGRMTGSLEA